MNQLPLQTSIEKRIATRKALTTSKAQRLIDIKTNGRQNAHNLLVVSAVSTRKRHHPKLQNETNEIRRVQGA
jgi:hypothetical protein